MKHSAKTAEILKLCNELIAALESNWTPAELLSDCPFRDLYIDARAARYQMINAPELF